MIKLLFLFLLPLQLLAQNLYVVHGRSGLIEKDHFVMYDVDHSVVYFTQEEERQAGAIPLREFVEFWERDKPFGQRGASAHYISYVAWNAHFNQVPILLQHPRYNEADETLTFTIGGERPHPEKLGEVALFLTYEP